MKPTFILIDIVSVSTYCNPVSSWTGAVIYIPKMHTTYILSSRLTCMQTSAIVPAGPLATKFAHCRERVFKKINWKTAISPSTRIKSYSTEKIYYSADLILTVYTISDLFGYRSFHFTKYVT